MQKEKTNKPENKTSIQIEDLTVKEERAAEVSGGGWGSSSYQYAFAGTYGNVY